MPQHSAGIKNSQKDKIIFILSIGVWLFISFASLFDVYYFVIVGAIYELLWFPVLILVFTLPVLSFIFWRNDKFKFRSVYPMILLIFSIIILLMIIKN
jgi:hypothetical protein